MENKSIGVEREQWGSNFGFVMAAAGSAIGLGNIWRFPYLAGENGGGAFIVIYLLAAFLIGFAVMLCEFAIGRAGQKNAIGSFKALAAGTPWWITGAFGVLAAFMILSFYGVVAGWTMAYVWKTISGALSGIPADQLPDIFVGFITNPVQPIIWQAFFMILTVGIVVAGIKGGIEKWSVILMPAIFGILVLLIIRGMTLEGSMAGVSFLLKPDFSQVTGSVVLAALGQAFFSLSLGMGTMITYGSYLNKKENMPSSAATIIGLDTGVAVLAGFAIFPALFAVGFEPTQGPGLVFMVLPAVFDTLPFGAFFGAMFFLLLAIAALTSAISILECVVAYVKDEFNVPRPVSAVTVGFIIFLVGVTASLSMSSWSHILIPWPGTEGINLFDFYDNFSAKILLPLGGMLICLFTVWVWKPENAFKEITNEGKFSFAWLPAFKILAGIVAPIVIAIVLLYGFGLIGTAV